MLTFGDFWKIVLAVIVTYILEVVLDEMRKKYLANRLNKIYGTKSVEDIENKKKETIGFKYEGEEVK